MALFFFFFNFKFNIKSRNDSFKVLPHANNLYVVKKEESILQFKQEVLQMRKMTSSFETLAK